MSVSRRGALLSSLASIIPIDFHSKPILNNKDGKRKEPPPIDNNFRRKNNMAPIVNARSMRNGWGVNDGGYSSATAAALNWLGCRWVRNDFGAGVTTGNFHNLQAAMVGYPDPNVKIQGILYDYFQNSGYSWNVQQGDILSVASVKNPNGTSMLGAIEGPNEMGSGDGNGSVFPNSNQLVSNNSFANDTNIQKCMVAWAQALSDFRKNYTGALSGVEILAPTVLDFTGGNGNYPGMNIRQYVDYGCFHYYSNTTGGSGGCPSGQGSGDELHDMYTGMSLGQGGGQPLSMVQSECGPQANNQGGGYAHDLVSAAWSVLMEAFDHFALGGHRFMIYCLFNSSNAEFGLFNNTDPNSPTPKAMVLKNFSNLMSLGNNYNNSANFTDNAPFMPAYSGNGFSVNGLQNAGKSGYSLIMPKSDGSTMIAVWREPQIDNGGSNGTSQVPGVNNVTVNLGGSYAWKVYDPSGGGGGSQPHVSVTTAPIASGNGSTVPLALYGTPLLIELAGSGAPIPPIKKITESKSGSTITNVTDAPLGDSQGNSWSLVTGSNGVQVAINGNIDTTTGQVIALTYVNKIMWQENSGKMWWGKSDINAAWSPSAGVATAPIQAPQPIESKDGSIVSIIGPTIIDGSSNTWSIVAGSNGNQVAVNGVVDVTTGQVLSLAYVAKVVWQENIGKLWWSKTSPTASWLPANGTTIDPTVVVVPSPTPKPTPKPAPPNTSVLQALIGTTSMQLMTFGSVTAKTAVTALNKALAALKAVV